MKSIELKKRLQGHYFQNGFNMSCTEFGVFGGWADVFVYQKNGYTHEFEVKVDSNDLMHEINCIDHVLNGDQEHINYEALMKHSGNKYSKHHTYLNSAEWTINHSQYVIPNKFSFVVSQDLYEKLLKGGLKSKWYRIINLMEVCGYGFYVVDPNERVRWCLERISKPNFLHKVKKDVMHKFAQRLFVENYNNFISKPI